MTSVRVPILLIILLFSLSLSAADQQQDEGLVPVPVPQLNHLEPSVSRQLVEGRRMVDAVVSVSTVEKKKRASAYGELGLLYHTYKLSDAAKACYRNAVALDPGNFDWNYAYGFLLQSIGGFSEALDIYRYIREKITPRSVDTRYLLYIRIGECLRSLNRPGEAKGAFQSALRLNPKGPSVLARLGELALDEKRYAEATRYLNDALKHRPDANKLHYSLAMAYRGTGEITLARSHLEKYGKVGVQPPDPLKEKLQKLATGYRVHLLAGKLAFSVGRYVEAEEAYRKAIAASPDQPGAYIDLGTTLGNMGKYKEAFNQFKAALKLAPENVTVHFNMGSLYFFLGHFTEAVKYLQVVVEKAPHDSGAHLTLADALTRLGQFDQAIEHYKTAIKIKGDSTKAWLNLSSLHFGRKRYRESLKVLEKGHSRLPRDGLICHALARLLAGSPDISIRNGKRALELALQVFQSSPTYRHARTVAMAYAQLNDCDEAVEWISLAISLATSSSQPDHILKQLNQNLDYLKHTRPCLPPANK